MFVRKANAVEEETKSATLLITTVINPYMRLMA
jgi:hypothetical protein